MDSSHTQCLVMRLSDNYADMLHTASCDGSHPVICFENGGMNFVNRFYDFYNIHFSLVRTLYSLALFVISKSHIILSSYTALVIKYKKILLLSKTEVPRDVRNSKSGTRQVQERLVSTLENNKSLFLVHLQYSKRRYINTMLKLQIYVSDSFATEVDNTYT